MEEILCSFTFGLRTLYYMCLLYEDKPGSWFRLEVQAHTLIQQSGLSTVCSLDVLTGEYPEPISTIY